MPISPASTNGYEFNSRAEKQIYQAAKESGFFNNTEKYLFHSLNIVKTGNDNLKGEVDFVYLDQDCLLFFEVKGGEVKFNSLTNEWWTLGGTKKGDPFHQAYKSLFQTRDKILPDLFQNRHTPTRLIYGIGVLFPECIKPSEFHKNISGQMEFDPELIYDYSDHKHNRLIDYIEKVKKYWANHSQFAGRRGISSKETSFISKFFRQNLHFRLPVSDLLKKCESEASKLISMQMYILDNIELNKGKGGLIMGGPGTGKTILALELLKRNLGENKKTLLICFNKNLAEHLNKVCKELNFSHNYEIRNIHNLYLDENFLNKSVKEIKPDSQEYNERNSEYWNQDLPRQFVRNLSDSKKELFDYIIIDEGQDILNEYHFDALGSLLKGGINSGNWAVFMDKEFQNIYNDQADEYFSYLKEVYPCFVYKLHQNCRNTLSTVKGASVQTRFPQMHCLRTEEAWKSEIRFYSSEIDLKNRINDTIFKMENEGTERKCISILCAERSQLISLIESNPNRYAESAFETDGKINISTIHSYKGLENKFILICAPENYDPNDHKQMSLIYIANTRAIAQSICFLNKKYENLIINNAMDLN